MDDHCRICGAIKGGGGCYCPDTHEPVDFIAATNILDRAHQALRTIDASDTTKPPLEKDLERVSFAIEAIEDFCRLRGIRLSEFQNL